MWLASSSVTCHICDTAQVHSSGDASSSVTCHICDTAQIHSSGDASSSVTCHQNFHSLLSPFLQFSASSLSYASPHWLFQQVSSFCLQKRQTVCKQLLLLSFISSKLYCNLEKGHDLIQDTAQHWQKSGRAYSF